MGIGINYFLLNETGYFLRKERYYFGELRHAMWSLKKLYKYAFTWKKSIKLT